MFNTSLNNGGSDRIGTINAWGGTTAPAGWLICDGSAISRTLYAGLFAVIGTTYGAGDSTTTFNLPDILGFCKNQSIIGNGDAIGTTDASLTTSNDAYYIENASGNRLAISNSGSNTGVGITTNSSKSGIVTASAAAQETRAIIKY